jgi:hypothetical protein
MEFPVLRSFTRAAAGLFRATLTLRPFRARPLPSLPHGLRHTMYVLILTGLTTNCTTDISIPLPEGEPAVVVEGYIEPGLPPLVFLSTSVPYFGDLSPAAFAATQIRGAVVTVTEGSTTVTLQEVSIRSLPVELRSFLGSAFGLDYNTLIDSLGLDLYFYTSSQMLGQIGRSYRLSVQAPGVSISALTTLPELNPVDSVVINPHPQSDRFDTLYSLSVRYSDPAGRRNYIRYFTQRNQEPFYPGYFSSVLDDRSLFNVDGQSFTFPIERGWDPVTEIDEDLYIYFVAGDTVTLRWCAIDEAHHGFWSSLEFDQASVGNPFASPVIIRSNIQGGLGIWGGYSASYRTVVIPPR